MRAPSTASRIVCAVIGAIVAPVAVALISAGGGVWAVMETQYAYRGGNLPLDRLVGPTLLMLLGLILLVGVVLTGLVSAAGLVAAGIVGIVPALGTLAPGLAIATVTSRLVPVAFVDPLFRGLPVAILPLLGFMGLVLVSVRRRPPVPSTGSALLGAVVALVALVLGGAVLMWGVQLGITRAFTVFDTRLQPLPALLVVVGILLIGIGIGASRWSPFALVLPAALLLLLSLVNVVMPSLYTFPPREVVQPTSIFLIIGGGVAVAAAQLAFTAVLLVVRARTRRLGPPTAGGPGTAANAVAGAAYPPAPGYPYPAQTPPAQGPTEPA